jgi:hypothetical protein
MKTNYLYSNVLMYVYLDKGDLELRNIVIISNHPPAEILEAIDIS